ncbi:MAG: hypothetical protein KDN19_08915 [Verrucomicrobiae bacterium]|nr:hypothetical protein [Verrucomicrobiae bacterium]
MTPRPSPTPLCFIAAVAAFASVSSFSGAQENSESLHWYRGNTHTHSLWSDGNDFPEMITAWYKDRGYDFMALSDHNTLAEGERWMTLDAIAKRQRAIGRTAMEKYQERWGDDWVETRETNGVTEVRLKTLAEYRGKLEKPGEFLIVQAEEISNSAGGKPIHINAVNLETVIPAIKSDDANDLRKVTGEVVTRVRKAAELSGRPILAHLNHPNFQWAFTPEDLAHVAEVGFFEVYNGHPGIHHLGDESRPGDERIWDIANTIRIAELDREPLLGVATDDSHTYHGGDVSPGRGWVMVHAPALEPNALVEAMQVGDFYASSGVALKSIAWDPKSRTLSLKIDPGEGATYSTAFIGTRSSYDATKPTGENGIGEVFAELTGNEVSFTLPEDALYLRATVTSSEKHDNPSFPEQRKQAWTQPVGWRAE